MVEEGKKTIVYKDKEYFIKKLLKLHLDNDTKEYFSDGDFYDNTTGETYPISKLKDYLESKYKDLMKEADVLGYNKKLKLKRESIDVDLNKIKEIYANCPPGYEVDHIIPLQGE